MPNLSLNFADLEPRQRYKLLCGLVVPRPIALVTTLSPEGVVARVASVSFVAALPEPEREGVLAEVRKLLATDPKTRGREEVELPYRTDVYWAKRR